MFVDDRTPRGVFNSISLHTAHYFCMDAKAALKPSNQQLHSPLCGSRSFHGEISQTERARGIQCPLSLGSVMAQGPQMGSRSL